MRRSRTAFVIVAALALAGCGPGAGIRDETSVSAAELAERIRAGSPPLVLDVRSPEEYELGHIPGAINVPHDQLSTRLSELPSDRAAEIVVHCQSGRRAGLAEAVLREGGYSNVRDLAGHWRGWRAAELPTE